MQIPQCPLADDLIVLDFETTGLSPNQGDRTIEIGAVRIKDGRITERFQALMNPGMPVSSFIEGYTGITNTMLKTARPCHQVMAEFFDFMGNSNLVAHNASFDKRFLDAEFARLSLTYSGEFSCSLLIAKRIFQNAGSYSLGHLVDYATIEGSGDYHRALYDAEMTAKLWLAMLENLQIEHQLSYIPFSLIQKLAKTPKKSVATFLQNAKLTLGIPD